VKTPKILVILFYLIECFLGCLRINNVQICSSQWTAVEQEQANSIARSVLPDITLVNIPPGLDLREGGPGIIKFLETAIGGYCGHALSYLPMLTTDGVRSALDRI
jgi:hypothetical protein